MEVVERPAPTTARAIIIMSAAMLLVPGMDAIAKYLATTHEMAPASITFGRFFIQMVCLMAVILACRTSAGFKTGNLAINLVRGAMMGIASMLFFLAVKYMPLADAIAIFFLEPLILMLLSSWFLSEVVGIRRKIAAVIGFGGALLVIQPSYALFGPVSLLPVLVAFIFAFYLVLTRKFALKDHPVTMQFYAGLGGVLAIGAVLMAGQVLNLGDFSFTLPPNAIAWFWLLVIGLIATIGHLLIVIAFSMAPASILAPFQYVEIISATLFGFLIFGDFPTPMKWLGIVIIVGAGLYTFFRERQIDS